MLLLYNLGLYWAKFGKSCESVFDAFYEGAETLTRSFFRCERPNFDVTKKESIKKGRVSV